MFKFQNCSAPSKGDADSFSEVGSGPGFIDDLVNKKLVFVENLIVTKHDSETIHFDGLCDRESDGKAVDWVIEDVSSRDVVLEGSSECVRGGFRVTADQMNDLECNVDYDLVAAVGEHHDNVFVRKKCKPMSTVEDESVNSGGSYPKDCYFELENEEHQSEATCYRACYASGKLYSREQVLPDQCNQ